MVDVEFIIWLSVFGKSVPVEEECFKCVVENTEESYLGVFCLSVKLFS